MHKRSNVPEGIDRGGACELIPKLCWSLDRLLPAKDSLRIGHCPRQKPKGRFHPRVLRADNDFNWTANEPDFEIPR